MALSTVGIIYYTSNKLKPEIKEGCWRQIEKSGLPITVNDKVIGRPGAISMFKQILDCLQRAKETYVYFCEHDVLYHPAHFNFIPPSDDTFYYNTNVWLWNYHSQKIVTYAGNRRTSGICVNRELAMNFYENRLKIIRDFGFDKIPTNGCPRWAYRLNYEPGSNKYGELALVEEWQSEYPNIDIRQGYAHTKMKMELWQYRRKPINWREDVIDNLLGWKEPWLLVQ